VEQFKNNKYEKNVFIYNMEASQNHWYANFLLEDLKQYLWECKAYKDSLEYREIVIDKYNKLAYYIEELTGLAGFNSIPEDIIASLNEDSFSSEVAEQTEEYLDSLTSHFRYLRDKSVNSKDSVEAKMGNERLVSLVNNYVNMKLKALVMDWTSIDKSIETPRKIIQKYEPGYMKPVSRYGRAHFYAPYKQIGNIAIDTFRFNVLVLWLVTFTLYIALYYSLFQKAVSFVESLRVTKSE